MTLWQKEQHRWVRRISTRPISGADGAAGEVIMQAIKSAHNAATAKAQGKEAMPGKGNRFLQF